MKIVVFSLLFASGLWGQAPSCQTNPATINITAIGRSVYTNNSANPRCSKFAVTWTATAGISALSVTLEGSDNGSSWTAFTGTNTLLAGTVNPSTALSGTIIIQAQSQLAFIGVHFTSITGSGGISFQLQGYNQITSSTGAGGGCGALGGDLQGTCAAAIVIGVEGAAVPKSAGLLNTNSAGQLGQANPIGVTLANITTLSLMNAISGPFFATTDGSGDTNNGVCAIWAGGGSNKGYLEAGNLTDGVCLMGIGGSFVINSAQTLQSAGTGTITADLVKTAAGATTTTNGAIKYDTTNQNLHTAQNSADAIVATTPPATPVNNDCVKWIKSGGQISLGDAGLACGSGGGGSPTFPVNPQTSTYQVVAGDFSACKNITAASGTFTVTLVASGSQPTNGQCIWVTNYGSGVVTIARSGQNINGGTSSLTLPASTATAPNAAFIVSDGSNYFASLASQGGGGGGGGPTVTTGNYASLPATCTHTSTQSDIYGFTNSPYNQGFCTATNTWSIFYPPWGAVTVPPTSLTGASTTLNGAINNSTTTCVVSADLSPAASVPFLALIDTEIVYVSAKGAGNVNWTCLRGFNTTTAASHLNGATVTLTNWQEINFTNATVDLTQGATLLTSVPDAANSEKALMTAIPVAPFTITALVNPLIFGASNDSHFGVCVAEGTTAKFYSYIMGTDENGNGNVYDAALKKWTNYTTDSAPSANQIVINAGGPPELIIKDVGGGGNITFTIKLSNGITFQSFAETDTTFLTSGAHSAGICTNPREGTTPVGGWLLSWNVTTP